MKKKVFSKKLSLNKKTIANLADVEMGDLKGGKVPTRNVKTCLMCTFGACFSLGEGCSDWQIC